MSEAEEFEGKMYELEQQLQDKDEHLWYLFEEESGSFWEELGVNNWCDAFKQDAIGCVTYKKVLKSYLKD